MVTSQILVMFPLLLVALLVNPLLVGLALGPRTFKITSNAPVRGNVQYSNNGRSFFFANLKLNSVKMIFSKSDFINYL